MTLSHGLKLSGLLEATLKTSDCYIISLYSTQGDMNMRHRKFPKTVYSNVLVSFGSQMNIFQMATLYTRASAHISVDIQRPLVVLMGYCQFILRNRNDK